MNKKLLILYDYFDPAYKAGGPIRSLVNLVRLIGEELEIYVLTSDQDHDGAALEVKADVWIHYQGRVQVKYLSWENRKYGCIKSNILQVDPDVVYINGMFSLPFVVYPLRAVRHRKDIRSVIAPRGMLQRESLAIKPWKKKIYLGLLKALYLKNVHWHVTTEQERTDLGKMIAGDPAIHLLGNVPSYDPDYKPVIRPVKTKKVLGTVALISPMKNIHLVLSALKEIKHEIEYHLYGPVKDQRYWSECQGVIKTLPSGIKVIHHGEIDPGEVADVVASFDYYIQPSKSENFGHSIFEAFNQGTPVIISDQTPWKGLRTQKAGWDVNLSEPNALSAAIREALEMDDQTYSSYRRGARRMAEDYMQSRDLKKLYLDLFS